MASRLSIALLAFTLCAVPSLSLHAQDSSPQKEWNAPPEAIQQDKMMVKAFKDGIDAAQVDMLHHKKLDFKTSSEYKHPPKKMPAAKREAYQNAFAHGYVAALHHAGY